jgi:hypothetical protein
MIIDVGGVSRSILVAGTGRSGTTWIGAVVAAMTRGRLIFEPLFLDEQGQFPVLRTRQLGQARPVPRRLYVEPDAGSESRYFRSIDRVLKGRIRSAWTDSDARSGVYRRRVIKDIRVNLLLPYIVRTWPELKIVWVESVVASQIAMAKLGWGFDRRGEAVSEGEIADPWLADAFAAMRRAGTPAEVIAHRWCIETMFPCRHGVHHHHNVRLVSYEALVENQDAWDPVSHLVAGKAWSGPRFARLLRQPSATSRPKVDPLPKEMPEDNGLSHNDIDRIESVVRSYGAANLFPADNPSVDVGSE